MKKFQLMTLLGLFVCVFTFVACGDDDDDETVTNPIVGTWVYEGTFEEGDGQFYTKHTDKYTFDNGGKFVAEFEMKEGRGNEVWGQLERREGTYIFSATDNVLKLTVTAMSVKSYDSEQWENEPMDEPYTENYKVVFNGNKATFYWMSDEGKVSEVGMEFTKKK